MGKKPPLKSIEVQASASGSRDASPTPRTAMLSHRGRVRHENQDTCAARPELGAYVVCDGMGGAAAGAVASRLAAEAFLHALTEPCAEHGDRRLSGAVRAANEAVFRHSLTLPGLRGMGTTLVAALRDDVDAAVLWLAHVGDSRCYRMRQGTLELLTEDHSLVEEQVRAGRLSRVEAESSPLRNIITRAVGSEPVVEAEIAAHTAQAGDLYLLATDGLTRELEDAQIARILTEVVPRTDAATMEHGLQHDVLEHACQALIAAANACGGGDNITVLLIGC